MSNYDPSKDYARYPTLSPIREKPAASYAQCTACGGTDFRIQLPHHTIICKNCSTIYQMVPPSQKTPLTQANVSHPLSAFQIACTSYAMSSITFILRPDGTIRANTQLPRSLSAVAGWTQIASICAGSNHIAGLRTDGTVMVAGLSEAEQTIVQSWEKITSIAATSTGVLGLCADGTVCAAGVRHAVLEQLQKWTSITSISAVGNQIIGVRRDGTLRAIGNVPDEIYGWDQITEVAMGVFDYGRGTSVLGLRRSGRVISTGYFRGQSESIQKCRDVRAIAASNKAAVALKNDGTIEILSNTTGTGAILAASKWKRIQSVWVCGNFITALRSDGFIHCTNPRIQRFIVEALD